MKATALGGVIFACLFVLAWAAPEVRAETRTGKQIFLNHKCNKCHAISVEGILKTKKKKSASASKSKPKKKSIGFDDDFGGSAHKKKGAPDLSGVGNRHEADWMKQWLKKKIRKDNGKKHKKTFKGSDEDFETLIQYLVGLKTDAPDEGAK